MAEIMGSALLSAFFNVLFDKLATEEVKNFLRPKKVINKLLEKLKVSLLSANKLLDVAEEKQIEDEMVEKWLNELKDVVYKASELGDKIETEALRRKLGGHQSARNKTSKMFKLFSKNSFDNYVKVELEGILSSLEHLLSQKDALGLVPAGTGRSNYSGVTPTERFRPTPVAHESAFCGRKDIKEAIIQSLRSADVCDENIGVIPIIGAGGLGKTTLAQIIYKDPDVENHFPDARAWVTISTEFDLPAIIRRIIGQVSDSSQIDGNVDQQVLLFKLIDALKGKKFLLVLDDVWSEDHGEWNNLKSCFESGERGSKIIVTTRSSSVASIAAPNQPLHFLPELPEEDCRQLFEKTAFTSDQDRDAHPDLQEIGEKIVEKCKGLPLSAKSVGGILRGDRDLEKWESILKSSVWELLQKTSKKYIIPSLWLSYRYLPSDLKRCFAYCSIFPKDYLFRKEEIVQLWMAEGFLENVAGKRGITMEEVGKRYFEELISRSLFQSSQRWYGDQCFIMHDLVHDLAMYVSGKFCFWMDEDKTLHDLPCETRHLSYNLAMGDTKKFEGLSKAKRLHTFVGFELSHQSEELDILKVLEEFLVEGACLRVLSLSSYEINSLCDSVGKLKHLRYLNLSYTAVRELPHSVGTLYNLQTLLLSSCKNLTRLPSNLGSLINLQHLDTRSSPLEEMPPKMCNLKKLHTLTNFVLGKQSGSSIKDLGVLENLHGRIRVSGLQNVSNVDDALKANLKNKKNLSELALEWEGQSDERDSRREEKVLDALQPHPNLKELFVSKYGGTSFPDWLGDSGFLKIERMHLNGCQDCRFLPALGRLASIKELKLKGFNRLETIGDGFYGNDSLFKSLEVLHFENMPEWKKWSVIEVPHLKELKLKGCPKLVRSLPNSNTITSLDICGCESLDFPENQLYPSLESLQIVRSCCSIKRLSLEHFPKLNWFTLEELECLVELTGESTNELKRLSIKKCPKLEFMGNGCYGSLEDLKIEKCEALKSIPLDYFPKLNWFTLEELECLVELTGESTNELKRLSIKKCPKLELMGNGYYGSLEDLKIEKCEALKSIPLDYFPKLNWFTLEELECLVELTGESTNELKRLSINKCPKLEFMGNGCYGSLEDLKIEKCEALKSIPLDYFPKLNRFTLKELECLVELTGYSPDELKELSIVKCPRLEFLGNRCYGLLNTLKIKKCEALMSIPLDYFPKLNKLTLGDCENFESFRFAEEPPLVLKSLTLKGLPKFVSFPEGGLHAPNLKDFYIYSCENLRSLPQQMHRLLPSLKLLHVGNCGEIESWPEGGLPSNLESLRILRCKKLAAQVKHWDLQVTCLKSFSIDGCGEELLDSFPPEGLLPTSLTSLQIRNFRRLKTLNIHEFQHLKELFLSNCDELQCLPEESLPNSLSYLAINNCPLIERRY